PGAADACQVTFAECGGHARLAPRPPRYADGAVASAGVLAGQTVQRRIRRAIVALAGRAKPGGNRRIINSVPGFESAESLVQVDGSGGLRLRERRKVLVVQRADKSVAARAGRMNDGFHRRQLRSLRGKRNDLVVLTDVAAFN